ncbi:DUF3800 domain-containing protein [Xanthobacter autotrophicus DSM 597]|uniref:DUF3800 domain-containing protein n=1 Tax=Xanthobacter wiegelii TaxID=3119913 RepID=UPI003727B1DD
MLVFIDESGDPGFKLTKGSSPFFVVALVAFPEVDQSVSAAQAIDDVAKKIGVKNEFKFSSSRPEVRDAFFACVMPFHFCVRAIAIEKDKIYSPHLRAEKDAFYAFFVKSMLKFNGGLLKNAKVIIDGSGDRIFKAEIASYLKRHVAEGAIRSVRFSNSKNDRLVQMADMCTGAIARSYRTDRAEADRWHQQLRPKIEDVWNFK